MWQCPICQEQIGDQFDACWQCGHIIESDEEKVTLSEEEGSGVICPQCDFLLPEPDWRCPKCYYHFESDSHQDPNSIEKEVARSGESVINLRLGTNVVFPILPDEENVSEPERATRRNATEGMMAVTSHAVHALWFLLGGGFLVWLSKSISFLFPIDIAFLIMGLILIFGYCLGHIIAGIYILFVSFSKPNVTSPVSTLSAFLKSVNYRLYTRAYNLLTDKAQKDTYIIDLKRTTDLTTQMSDIIEIKDINSFTAFWKDLPFSWKPILKKMTHKDIDENTVSIRLPIKPYLLSNKRKKLGEFVASFISVRRNGEWFLCNGFFWPNA